MLSEEQQQFVERHMNLVHYAIRKGNYASPGTDEYGEYLQQGALSLCLAVDRYEENKGKFLNYALSYIINELKTFDKRMMWGPVKPFRKMSKERKVVGYDVPSYLYIDTPITDDSGNELESTVFADIENSFEDDIITKIIIEEFAKTLKDKEKRLLLLIIKGYLQYEAAEICNTSAGMAGLILRSVKKKLRKKI